MAHYRLIIPLLNQNVSTFDDLIWHLANDVYCKVLDESDHGAIFRYLDELEDEQYRQIINSNPTCIYIDKVNFIFGQDQQEIIKYTREQSVLVQSVFNLFSDSNPLLLNFAIVILVSDENELSALFTVDLNPLTNIHYLRTQPFCLKPSASQNRINQFYRVVCEVSDKYPEIIVTLGRFSSSLIRATDSDRIIDITISLESLIREKNEIRFKFAGYLTLITSNSILSRSETFKLLGALYDARSGLVHGTEDEKSYKKAISEVLENWEKVLHLTKGAISYYMLYRFSEIHGNVKISWKEHLRNLMLGIDGKLIN